MTRVYSPKVKIVCDRIAYQPVHFHKLGEKPPTGTWVRPELDADKGVTDEVVDGFAYFF